MLKLIHSSCKCVWKANVRLCLSHLMLLRAYTVTSGHIKLIDGISSLAAGQAFSLEPSLLQCQCRLMSADKSKTYYRKYSADDHSSKVKKTSMNYQEVPSDTHQSTDNNFQVEDAVANVNLFRRSPEKVQFQPQPIPEDFRIWEDVKYTNIDQSNGKALDIKILSYNVLAQCLLEGYPYLYRDCSPECLKWKHRAALIFDEITKLAPDIICFQEVQASHIGTFFSQFEDLGYFRVFKQKTGRRKDGCAIYFNKAMFIMQDTLTVEYYQPEIPILNKDNIGLMIKLAPREMPDASFVVATTHLLYAPPRTDVRLAQIKVLLAELDRFAFDSCRKEDTHLPIILTGDFNSLPDSAVIQLLESGSVRANAFRSNAGWTKVEITDNCQHLAVCLARQNGRPIVTPDKLQIYNTDYVTGEEAPASKQLIESSGLFDGEIISHSLKLISVYDHVKHDGQIEASTFQDYWITVDYIYFSRHSSLKLKRKLRLPTAKECEVLGRLPNHVYGSDHLALAAVFELKSKNLKQRL